MSFITITKLYESLSTKLGKETAENLTNFIENKINNNLEDKLKIFATKEDLLATKEDLLRETARLDTKIGETKSELIRWMFIFWIGQIGATLGIIYLKG